MQKQGVEPRLLHSSAHLGVVAFDDVEGVWVCFVKNEM